MSIKFKGNTIAQNGFSPTIDVSEIDGGHRLSITDITGTQTFDVEDGTSVEFDNTMTTNEDGIATVANPNRGIMTQEEYDALPEGEKAKGTYIISNDQNGSDEPLSNTNVYSEEEVRIGTWIDGKPYYRRIITGTYNYTTPNQESYIQTMQGVSGVNIHFCSGIAYATNHSGHYILPYYYDGTYGKASMILQYSQSTYPLIVMNVHTSLSIQYELEVCYTKDADMVE